MLPEAHTHIWGGGGVHVSEFEIIEFLNVSHFFAGNSSYNLKELHELFVTLIFKSSRKRKRGNLVVMTCRQPGTSVLCLKAVRRKKRC
jgi:hypothetical protein